MSGIAGVNVASDGSDHNVLNTAPLIGGAIFYVGFVTATGILQTVSRHAHEKPIPY